MLSRHSASVHRAAVAVFEAAQRSGEAVTMALVNRIIAELDVGPISAATVYRTARGWGWTAVATRHRAQA